MGSLLLAVLAVGLCVAAAVVGLVVVRRRVPHRRLAAHTEVAGYVFATLGVVYAVILGLVVVAVWTEFEEARTAAEQEANALLDLVRLADAWPEAERGPVRAALLAYGRVVVDEEWPAMARGEAPSAAAEADLDEIWRAYAQSEQGVAGDGPRFAESLAQLDALGDARGLRVLASHRGIPGLMWAVLIAGGVLTVGFGYLFGVESGVAHGAMVAALTALIALLLVLVQALNAPFRDPVRLPPAGMERTLRLAAGSAALAPTAALVGPPAAPVSPPLPAPAL